jgi:hypothetical protein
LAPIDVRAEDEIGDLARAFERVQQTAARLVERQAASRRNVAQMFGHIGRRTQNLVGRQIALIDQLERGEEDPGRLQHLYRLDHVSSRLRRNASSLVVLSGAAGAEPHVTPVQLGDVVRLALAEIEDYTRVDISVPDDLVVIPAMVGDLVLMLAELMENATTFSPPHTRVSVSAARSATGTGARLTIVDRGIGMPPERLAEENARLTRRERLDLAPTEVLGLFVVGRLARRHGVGVALEATPGGGVTATVELAQHMLVPVEVEQGLPVPIQLAETGVRALTGAVVAPPDPPFDVAALQRANRTLATGPTWNAFAIEAARSPAKVEETAPDSATPRPALRKRVRRAHLPADASPRPAESPAPTADPDAVRALMEEFEDGVRRALREVPPNESTMDISASPNGPFGLTRRVPGATLRSPAHAPTPPPADYRPPDPEQVRNLVEEFESGVARALREVGADHQHEEEEPR